MPPIGLYNGIEEAPIDLFPHNPVKDGSVHFTAQEGGVKGKCLWLKLLTGDLGDLCCIPGLVTYSLWDLSQPLSPASFKIELMCLIYPELKVFDKF